MSWEANALEWETPKLRDTRKKKNSKIFLHAHKNIFTRICSRRGSRVVTHKLRWWWCFEMPLRRTFAEISRTFSLASKVRARDTRRPQETRKTKTYRLWQWLHAWWSASVLSDSVRTKIEARSAIDRRPVLGAFGSVVCLTKTGWGLKGSLELLENASRQTKDSWISVNRWRNGLGDQLTHIWHCFQSVDRTLAVNHSESDKSQCFRSSTLVTPQISTFKSPVKSSRPQARAREIWETKTWDHRSVNSTISTDLDFGQPLWALRDDLMLVRFSQRQMSCRGIFISHQTSATARLRREFMNEWRTRPLR